MVTKKRCLGCGTEKPNTDDFFSKHKPSPNGLRPRCKECQRAYTKQYLPSHRKERQTYDREHRIKWRYGIDKGKLLEIQNFRCANEFCGNVIDLRTGHVDHDHSCCSKDRSCGKCVRGVLCGNCNRAAGMLKDSAPRCRGLALYLEKSERRN